MLIVLGVVVVVVVVVGREQQTNLVVFWQILPLSLKDIWSIKKKKKIKSLLSDKNDFNQDWTITVIFLGMYK